MSASRKYDELTDKLSHILWRDFRSGPAIEIVFNTLQWKTIFFLNSRRRFFIRFCLHFFFVAAEKEFSFSCFSRVRSTYWWSHLARLGHSGIEIFSPNDFSVSECQISPLRLRQIGYNVFTVKIWFSLAASGVQCTNISKGRTRWRSTRFLIKKLVSGEIEIYGKVVASVHQPRVCLQGELNPNRISIPQVSSFSKIIARTTATSRCPSWSSTKRSAITRRRNALMSAKS